MTRIVSPMMNDRDTTWLERVATFAVRWRMPGLIAAIIITALAVPRAGRLTYNRSVESLYAPDNSQLLAFEHSKSLFGGDEFTVVAYGDPELMAEDDISMAAEAEQRLKAFADRFNAIPGVVPGSTQHLSLALSRRFVRARVRQMVEDFLIGRDGETTAIVLRLAAKNDTDGELARVVKLLHEAADSDGSDDAVVVRDIRQHLNAEQPVVTSASTLVAVGDVIDEYESDRDDVQETLDELSELIEGAHPDESRVESVFYVRMAIHRCKQNGFPSPAVTLGEIRSLLDDRRAAVTQARTLVEIDDLVSDEETSSTDPAEIMDRVRRALDRIGLYVARAETINEIRRVADEHEFQAYVVGEPVQIHDMFQIVQDDGDLLFKVSMALLSTVILVLFRRLRWVLLPVVVVVIAIKWTEAFFAVSGFRLSMVSSMLNSMVTIIGIATVTHITVHYREARKSLDAVDALRHTLAELLPAVFWTCATTAVGFAALLASDVQPVRSFGMMMSFASMLVVVITVMVLPGGVLMGGQRRAPLCAPAEARLTQALHLTSSGVERYPRLVLAGFLIAFLVALPGLFRLQIETDFSRNFRDSSPIVQSLEFVESRLGGAGTWEVNFPAPSKLDEEFLDTVRKLGGQLRDLTDDNGEELLKVVTLTDGLDMVPKLRVFLDSIDRRIKVLNKLQPEFVPGVYNPERKRMRIILRSKERQPSEQKLALIERVETLVRDTFRESDTEKSGDNHQTAGTLSASDPLWGNPPPRATGIFVLMALIIQSLLQDQLLSFTWAAAGIAVMMSFAFRSILTGLITLIPNVFPIVLIIGTMGWLGIPINIGTAMIASVSMGLTVDSTIHYISAFRRARQTMSVSEALQYTHQGVGRALVFAHLALIGGFSVLTLSQFIPLVYFGILLSLAMIGGLAGGLILLPLLLRMIERTDDVPEGALPDVID